MKKLHLQVHLDKSSKSFGVSIPARLLDFWKPGKWVLKLGLLLFALQFGSQLVHFAAYRGAAMQRHDLWNTLQELQHSLDALHDSLDSDFSAEEAIHMKYGLVPPGDAFRQMGTGGEVHPDSIFLSRLHPAMGMHRAVSNSMANIEAKIDRGEESYGSLKNFIEQKFTIWNHLPSISPTAGRFSSGFGVRVHPVTGEVNKMHFGIDISNKRWTPIYASADGVVELVKFQDFFGNYVVIDHGNGYVTKYGHMEKSVVKLGQFVQRYQLLGYMGNTGRTTGIHLHYEVWTGAKPLNPTGFILPVDYTVE